MRIYIRDFLKFPISSSNCFIGTYLSGFLSWFPSYEWPRLSRSIFVEGSLLYDVLGAVSTQVTFSHSETQGKLLNSDSIFSHWCLYSLGDQTLPIGEGSQISSTCKTRLTTPISGSGEKEVQWPL